MDPEIALARISAYIERHLPIPSKNWPEYRFRERSYARWAAYEIFERIDRRASLWLKGNIGHDPINIVEEFINEIDAIRDDSFLLTAEFICRVAKDAAEDIRELVIESYPYLTEY